MPQSQAPRPSVPSQLPKSSSGPALYIVAIVVLVALIGLMIWLKVRKPDQPVVAAPAPSPSASVVAPPTVGFDLPPPPEIDAGSDAESSAAKKNTGGGGSLCSMKCEGTSTSALESALRGAAGSSKGCYERALRTNSMLQGRMRVAVRIAANGQVCGASLAEDTMRSSEVSACVLSLFRGRPFPPPSGGCVDANIPLAFTPQEGKK